MVKLTRMMFFAMLFAVPITLIKGIGFFKFYTLDVFLAPLVLTFLFTKLSIPRWKFHFTGTDKLILLLFATITISFLLSNEIVQSIPNLMDWMRYLAIYYISRTLFEREAITPVQFENILIWIGIILLLIGAAQVITNSRIGLIGNWFGEGTGLGSSAKYGSFHVLNRVSGTGPNSNVYAMWLNLFCTLGIVRSFIRKRYFWSFIETVLSFFVMISTMARGANFAFILFLIIFLLISRHRLLDSKLLIASVFAIPTSFIFAIISLFFIDLQFEQIIDTFLSRIEQIDADKHGSAEGRLMLIKIGFELLSSDFKVFFFGTGADNFPYKVVIHNMWVRIFAEHGVFVLLTLIALLFSFYKEIRRFRLKKSKVSQLWVNYLLSTTIPFLLISSQVYHTAGSYNLLIPYFVIIAFVVSRVFVESTGREKLLNSSRLLGRTKKTVRLPTYSNIVSSSHRKFI